ncbi:MAG: hypothetical protein K0S55_1881, partial [Clostridia bacterium]|nr:hypothetical protein [Clostridia bacterium]
CAARDINVLRSSAARKKLIYALSMLKENDEITVKHIKNALQLPDNNPSDVLSHICRTKNMLLWNKKIIIKEYCVSEDTKVTAESILKQCKSLKRTEVDLKDAVLAQGNIIYDSETGVIKNDERWRPGNRRCTLTSSIATKFSFNAPLKIDATITTDSRDFSLYYGEGELKINNPQNDPGAMFITDISVDYCMDFHPDVKAPEGSELNITWILQKDFMAVLLDGQLVHYGENYPYMNIDLPFPTAPVRFGTTNGGTSIIKALTVSELE